MATPLSDSGQKIVDTFTRWAGDLVAKLERAESEKQELIATHDGETERLRREIDVQKGELIELRAKFGMVDRELAMERSDHRITSSKLAEKTSSLVQLRRSAANLGKSLEAEAAAFGGAVEDAIDKQPEIEAAERNLHGADGIAREIEQGLEEMQRRDAAAAAPELPAILRRQLPAPVVSRT